MILGDTIIALASAPGRSPLALIRLSGPATRRIASERLGIDHFQQEGATARHATLSLWNLEAPFARNPIPLRLPVRVIHAPAPRTYTGEDTLEILLPGNPALVDRVLTSLITRADTLPPDAVVRHAAPGEFSARAFLNGKMTIEAAEGVNASIAASSEAELESSARALRAEDAPRWRSWANETATLLALVEAGIDFTDQEDVVAISTQDLRDRAAQLAREIEENTGGRRSLAAARHIPLVVLAGKPNAGKSTLMNALLGRKRSVVSEHAGTTRDILIERADLSSLAPGSPEIELADTAGLDTHDPDNPDPIAADMQRRARETIAAADLVIWCDPDGAFEDAAGTPPETSAPLIRVRTKADRPSIRADAPSRSIIHVCALDGWNLAELARAIAHTVATSARASSAGGTRILLARHALALAEAHHRLESVVAMTSARDDAAIATQLRLALDALGSITGRLSPDDVLGLIFSRFCVGK